MLISRPLQRFVCFVLLPAATMLLTVQASAAPACVTRHQLRAAMQRVGHFLIDAGLPTRPVADFTAYALGRADAPPNSPRRADPMLCLHDQAMRDVGARLAHLIKSHIHTLREHQREQHMQSNNFDSNSKPNSISTSGSMSHNGDLGSEDADPQPSPGAADGADGDTDEPVESAEPVLSAELSSESPGSLSSPGAETATNELQLRPSQPPDVVHQPELPPHEHHSRSSSVSSSLSSRANTTANTSTASTTATATATSIAQFEFVNDDVADDSVSCCTCDELYYPVDEEAEPSCPSGPCCSQLCPALAQLQLGTDAIGVEECCINSAEPCQGF